MKAYFETIDKQIEGNRGSNLFEDGAELPLRFFDETLQAIANLRETAIENETLLIDYATDKAIEAFCHANQYYLFSSEAKQALRTLYHNLYQRLRSGTESTADIEKHHYQQLKAWLEESNPFAAKLYAGAGNRITPVACAEYSPEIQCDLLKIKADSLMEPILDIGCGRQAQLVRHLNALGLRTIGIDRFAPADERLICADWLAFHYEPNTWGTIVSHLGFSNHFRHHNAREDGHYIAYAQTYMAILQSLKRGGCFHYAPDLPFIEPYLDPLQFRITKYPIEGYDLCTSRIERIS